MRNDWKNLEIGNIPSDLVTGGYEFQKYERGNICNESITIPKMMTEILTAERNNTTKYRYRLKPLESIRITKEILEDLTRGNNPEIDDIDYLKNLYGRPVDIIDENN